MLLNVMKKIRREGRYDVLPGDNYAQAGPSNASASDAPGSPQESPTKKFGFLSKLFKGRGKNNYNEVAVESVNEQTKLNKAGAVKKSVTFSKDEPKVVSNEIEKKTVAPNEQKTRKHRKKYAAPKMAPVLEKPNDKKEGDKAETSNNNSSIMQDPKAVRVIDKNTMILQEFDPLMIKKAEEERKVFTPPTEYDTNTPVLQTIKKDKKKTFSEQTKKSVIKVPDLMAIQEIPKPPKRKIMRTKKNEPFEELKDVFMATTAQDTLITPNKSNDTMRETQEVASSSSYNTNASMKPEPTAGVAEQINVIIKEFNSSRLDDIAQEDKVETNDNDTTISISLPSSKDNNYNLLTLETQSTIKIPELKVAIMDSIQENDLPLKVKPIEELKEANDILQPAKANVSYESSEETLAQAIFNNDVEAIYEDALISEATRSAFNFDLPEDPARELYFRPPSEFDQPSVNYSNNNWNIWPSHVNDNLKLDYKWDKAPKKKLSNLENLLTGSNPIDQLGLLFYQDANKEEKNSRKKIAHFFAEEAKYRDNNNKEHVSTNVEITQIDLNEEDLKRYRESLKYENNPVDNVRLITTVQTALHFIEDLTKKHELKKAMWKGDNKNMEINEKEKWNKKAPLKPKMWLVFNRMCKEKVVICTPGEFYDSD